MMFRKLVLRPSVGLRYANRCRNRGELASSRASSVQYRASSPGPADALAAFAAIGGHGGILVFSECRTGYGRCGWARTLAIMLNMRKMCP